MGLDQLNQKINFIHSCVGSNNLTNDQAKQLRKSLNELLGYTVTSLNSIKNNNSIPEFTEKLKTGFDAEKASIKECCAYIERVQNYIVFSDKQIEKISTINTRFANVLKEAKSDLEKNYKDVTRIIKAMEKGGRALNNEATLFVSPSLVALNELEANSERIEEYLAKYSVVNFIRSVEVEDDDLEVDDLDEETENPLSKMKDNINLIEIEQNQVHASPKPAKAVSVFSTGRKPRPESRLSLTPSKYSNEAIMKKLDVIRSQLDIISTKDDVKKLSDNVESLTNEQRLKRVAPATEQTKNVPVETPVASKSAIKKWFLVTALAAATAGAGYVFYKKHEQASFN